MSNARMSDDDDDMELDWSNLKTITKFDFDGGKMNHCNQLREFSLEFLKNICRCTNKKP